MKYTVMVSDETVDVELERTATGIDATIGNRVYSLEVSKVRAGIYLLIWNHQSIEVSVVPAGGSYSASINGKQIPVEILDARRMLQRTARRGEGGISEIRAPMPGKIVRVLAVEGTDIRMHQGIVVMEAMKMQNEIKSSIEGRVQKLTVVEGDTVRSGDLIAIVEASPASADR